MIFNMQGENFFNNQTNYNPIIKINAIGNNLINSQLIDNQSYVIQHQNIMNIRNLMLSHLSKNLLPQANIFHNIILPPNQITYSNFDEIRRSQKANESLVFNSQLSIAESNLSQENSTEKISEIAPKSNNSKKISKREIKSSKNAPLSCRLKNMIKNYGKKCANFAIGEHGYPIIKQKLDNKEITRFRHFIRSKVKGITNINNFRGMLLAADDDTAEIEKFKKVFQFVSVIFIENYSVNWIMNSSRIKDVKGHIFARFKILRRVKDPKNFTYIH